MWDPSQYLHHVDERSRPFHELVGRIGIDPATVRAVADLGCGPGHLTVTLAERWPGAAVVGVDASDAMIERARTDHPAGDWRLADVRDWRPDAPLDVVVSNATLQWVPGHRALLDRLVEHLRPGGWLAFQVPGNHDAPAHRTMAELARSARWAPRVGHLAERDETVVDPCEYATDLFAAGCDHVDAWETTYVHVLAGEDPVLDWLTGTGLRPILEALGPDADAFRAELAPLLRDRYPSGPHGTLFPFRRIFAVARRATGHAATAIPPRP
jgi:trans-aconitate 2-methyltransferase